MQSSTDRLVRVYNAYSCVKQFAEKGTYLSLPSPFFRSSGFYRLLSSYKTVNSPHISFRGITNRLFLRTAIHGAEERGCRGIQGEIRVYRKRPILFSPRELFVARRRCKDV